MIKAENNALILSRTVTGWRICIDYRKLNKVTRKDHFPLPFMDQILDRLERHKHYVSLTDMQVTIRSPSPQKTRRKPPSRALLVHSHSSGCHFGYVTH